MDNWTSWVPGSQLTGEFDCLPEWAQLYFDFDAYGRDLAYDFHQCRVNGVGYYVGG